MQLCAAWAAELLRFVKTIDNKAKKRYIMIMVYHSIFSELGNPKFLGNDRFGLEIHSLNFAAIGPDGSLNRTGGAHFGAMHGLFLFVSL